MDPLDAKGLPVKVGDVVLIPCRVKSADTELIEVELPDTADNGSDQFGLMRAIIEPHQVVRANPLEVDVTSVLGAPA